MCDASHAHSSVNEAMGGQPRMHIYVYTRIFRGTTYIQIYVHIYIYNHLCRFQKIQKFCGCGNVL